MPGLADGPDAGAPGTWGRVGEGKDGRALWVTCSHSWRDNSPSNEFLNQADGSRPTHSSGFNYLHPFFLLIIYSLSSQTGRCSLGSGHWVATVLEPSREPIGPGNRRAEQLDRALQRTTQGWGGGGATPTRTSGKRSGSSAGNGPGLAWPGLISQPWTPLPAPFPWGRGGRGGLCSAFL